MAESWEWAGPLTPLALTALSVLFGVLFALLALWVALPFALFGIRRHLREIQHSLDGVQEALQRLNRTLADRTAPQGRADPDRPSLPPGNLR